MADDPTPNQPASDAAYLKDATFPTGLKYMTEQEEARARLKASIDALTEQASLHAQMQKEPLKMLGGASAVGGVLGLIVGRQFRRSKKIYVDSDSPLKHQKALMKAQSKQRGAGQSVGGALIATLGTMAFKQVMDKVISPKLEEVASGLLDRAGQSPAPKPQVLPSRTATPAVTTPAFSAPAAAPAPVAASQARPVDSFVKEVAPQPVHVGVIPMPESKVEAKAVGTPIPEEDRLNPNSR